ncbi:DedA family protein [Streptomyces sp. NPDC051243]|uniref:DedA family protein n=1 Tax=Streptomyces sp. NPDC051243 TaxID=3365646 RepID=UPI003790DA0C
MAGAHWMYALLVLVTMPPMVPNSALLTGAGALAATGDLSLAPLAIILLTSAVLGDLGVFWLGRRSRGRTLSWLTRDARRRSTLDWASRRIQRYGVPSVIAMRFVPTGRGMGGLAAGIVDYPVRKYLIGAGIAEAVFLSYTIGLGYLGGRALPDDVPPFLIGPAISLLVAGSVVAAQRGFGMRSNSPVS